MVSRDDAARIAEEVVRADALGVGIREVLLPSEIAWRAPIVYGLDLSNCWVAYAETARHGIFSSTIVVIDHDTRRVVYKGSANDEG